MTGTQQVKKGVTLLRGMIDSDKEGETRRPLYKRGKEKYERNAGRSPRTALSAQSLHLVIKVRRKLQLNKGNT
jgi:hypothetical protein